MRITGQTPFTPELHISERLRCNAGGQFFAAPLSDDVIDDGTSNQKYGYSACSLMVLNKYFMGALFYHQESLQSCWVYRLVHPPSLTNLNMLPMIYNLFSTA